MLGGEAFGLYQLEALAAGIPIVQPAIAAFPEIAKVSGGGDVYEPNHPEALAEKWKEVISDPEKLKQMGKNGRESVKNTFNLNRVTEQMVEVYQRISS